MEVNMSLFSKSQVLARADRVILNEQVRKSFTTEGRTIDSLMQNFSERYYSFKTFDIFLSHSYSDKKGAIGLKTILEDDYGYSVYIDWIEDQDLDRTSVSKETATRLKTRMTSCRCLFYATSTNSSESKWMPWETGLMDGLKNKVAICPFIDNPYGDNFNGQEYLGIYPYVAEGTQQTTQAKKLWIHVDSTTYVLFDDWLTGTLPSKH
jgi:hypothetical protein